MVGTETEDAITANLPSGWQGTFLDSDKLRRLAKVSTNNLGDTIEDYSGPGNNSFKLTERDAIRSLADRVNTAFLLPERTIELPGLQLALDPSVSPGSDSLIEHFAALYKADNDTPSGTIKPPALAGTDDIVFGFANPEVYSTIANGNLSGPDNFEETGLSAGNTLELVGDSGIDTGANSANTPLSLDQDEYLFFTGDFIDLSGGKSVITKTQLTEVDDEDYNPKDALFSSRLSGAHIMTTQGTYATATVDIDAKIAFAGDAEVVPVAFYMAPGGNWPGLV